MSIVVHPVGRMFNVEITSGEEKVVFSFKQLDYKTKGEITGLVTRIQQGQLTIDASLQVFYNLKYGLKKVEGLVDHEGKPYQLEFEDKQKKELKDECVDALLATEISDGLQYTARELASSVFPSEIKNPLTGQKLEGIEVIPQAELGGNTKKS